MTSHIGKLMLALGILLTISVSSSAASPGDDPTDDPDTSVPFDGGISLLVASGVAYGVKQWRGNRKNNKEQDASSEVED